MSAQVVETEFVSQCATTSAFVRVLDHLWNGTLIVQDCRVQPAQSPDYRAVTNVVNMRGARHREQDQGAEMSIVLNRVEAKESFSTANKHVNSLLLCEGSSLPDGFGKQRLYVVNNRLKYEDCVIAMDGCGANSPFDSIALYNNWLERSSAPQNQSARRAPMPMVLFRGAKNGPVRVPRLWANNNKGASGLVALESDSNAYLANSGNAECMHFCEGDAAVIPF